VNFARRVVWRHGARRLTRGFLATLSPEEADLLYSVMRQNQQSMSRPITDPVANSLVQKNLLARSSGVGNIPAWTFVVPPQVWIEIKPHWPPK
jgi:Super-infection exclusion protein B